MKDSLVKANAQWRTQNQNKNHKAIRQLLMNHLGVSEASIVEGSRMRAPDDSRTYTNQMELEDDTRSQRSIKSSGSSN